MTVNIQLLEDTMQHIKDHEEDWNQGLWWCGTSGCFAGWACALSGEYTAKQLRAMASDGITPSAAQRQLGLDLAQITGDGGAYLFSGINSLPMLELMVKDLVNDGTLRREQDYIKEAHGDYVGLNKYWRERNGHE